MNEYVNENNVSSLWNTNKLTKLGLAKRKLFYDGEANIKSNCVDGQKKSSVFVNWIKYTVDSHVALNTSIPYQYSLCDSSSDKTALDNLSELFTDNDIHTIDVMNFSNAILYGCGVEVHSYDPIEKEIVITSYSPLDWTFLSDIESDEIIIAIHKIDLPINSFFQNKLIKEPTSIYTVYDCDCICTFVSSKKKTTLVECIEHVYGQVPIVLFYVNHEKHPFISDNILEQNMAYNSIYNDRITEIEFNVDGLLVLQGVSNEMDNPEFHNVLARMKKERTIVFPDSESDAKFVTKNNDDVKYENALKYAKADLLASACVPDPTAIMEGGKSAFSGLALKFRYAPMLNQASHFMKYIKKGLNKRIDLINSIWKFLNVPLLSEYLINTQYSLPVDLVAERQSLAMMKQAGLVSDRTLLELSSDVFDPEEELKRLDEQKNNILSSAITATNTDVENTVTLEEERTIQESEGKKPLSDEERMARRNRIEEKIKETEDNLKEHMNNVLSDIVPKTIMNNIDMNAIMKRMKK